MDRRRDKKVPMREIVAVDPNNPDEMVLRRAARLIHQGEVVGYPTETVYGLGANPFNAEAWHRIYQLKRRDPTKPIGLLISGERMLKHLVETLPDTARSLMKSFWPGPLTIVVKARRDLPKHLLGDGYTIALRVSSSPIANGLVDILGQPLTSSSANISGRPPACSAQEVVENFGGQVSLVIDGGCFQDLTPSTVVDVSGRYVKVIRPGRIGVEEIQRAVGLLNVDPGETRDQKETFNILFVCTGNTCRSPMAKGILEEMLPADILGRVRVTSAGTAASYGNPPAPEAVTAAGEDGVDISAHRSRAINEELLREADLVLTFSAEQKAVVGQMGVSPDRLFTLKEFDAGRGSTIPISDPAGKPLEAYRRCYQRIKKELERILPTIIRLAQEGF